MVSFVEQAILKVDDQSTAPIQSINNELKKLLATARKLKAVPIRISTITGVRRDLADLQARLKSISKSHLVNVNVKVSSSSGTTLPALNRSLAALNRRGPISMDIRVNGAAALRTLTNISNRVKALRDLGAITIPVGTTGGGLPPAGPGVRTGPGARRPGIPGLGQGPQLGTSLLQIWSVGFIYRLGSTIENAIVAGFARGTSEQDIADTRVGLFQTTPDETQSMEDASLALRESVPALSRGEALGLVSELFPTFKNNTDLLDDAAIKLGELIEIQIALGKDRQTAISDASRIARAGDQQGAFTDENGVGDLDSLNAFFDNALRQQIQLGSEFNATLVAATMKSLRVSKFGLDDRGFTTVMMLAEEQGSTAGVGVNQMIMQLSGVGVTKKAMAEQEEFGIRNDAGLIQQELLRQDPARYVREVIIPEMVRQGVDPNDPNAAIETATSLVSDRTAIDTLAALILKSDELKIQTDNAMARNVDEETISSVLDNSLLLAWAEAQGQFVGLLGEVGTAFEGLITPVLSASSAVSTFLANLVREGGAVGTVATVGGVAAGAYGLLRAGKSVLGAINPFSTANAALTSAGTNLNVAAAALQAAAAAQSPAGSAASEVIDTVSGNTRPGAGGRVGAVGKGTSLLGLIMMFEEMGTPQALSPENQAAKERASSVTRVIGSDMAASDAMAQTTSSTIIKSFDETTYALIDELQQVREDRSFAEQMGSPEAATLVTQEQGLSADLVQRGVPVPEVVQAFDNGAVDAEEALNTAFTTGRANLEDVFNTGSTQIESATAEFGNTAGAGILSFAEQFGQIVGQAAAAAIQNLNLNINTTARTSAAQPAPRLETGGVGRPF